MQGDGALEPTLQMGMPSSAGELLRRVHHWRRLDVAPVDPLIGGRFSLVAPQDRYLGALSVVEPDNTGGYWIVVQTWTEEPEPADHHEMIHLGADGTVLEHVGIENGEFAETASLSQFRLGQDNRLYQLFSDEGGLEIRSFDLGQGEGS